MIALVTVLGAVAIIAPTLLIVLAALLAAVRWPDALPVGALITVIMLVVGVASLLLQR